MLKYNGPTSTHFTHGQQYQVIQAIEHPLLGYTLQVKNDRGELSLISEQNKSFQVKNEGGHINEQNNNRISSRST